MRTARAVLLSIAAAAIPAFGFAEPVPGAESILLAPPQKLPLYERPYNDLSALQRWKVDIHGIRMAPLHPLVWGIRRVDRTENKQLVPIRPLYLRVSEEPEFELQDVTLQFSFKQAKVRHMIKFPEQKTPVLDLEFGGVFVKGPPGGLDPKDQAYVARLSASPLLDSGIYYRSFGKYLLLAPGAARQIESGREYRVQLSFSGREVRLSLDDAKFAVLPGDHRRGLFAMITCWHPLTMTSLQVRGSRVLDGERLPYAESGLIQTLGAEKT